MRWKRAKADTSEKLLSWLRSWTQPRVDQPAEQRERKVLSSSKDIRKHPVMRFCEETLKRHLQKGQPFKMRSGGQVYRLHDDGSIRLIDKDTRSVKQRRRERRELREKKGAGQC